VFDAAAPATGDAAAAAAAADGDIDDNNYIILVMLLLLADGDNDDQRFPILHRLQPNSGRGAQVVKPRAGRSGQDDGS
jgi:hypothetical protein